MATLVVYYSLSGTTRSVAMTLASELSADLEEIRCDRYSGSWRVMKAAFDNWRGRAPAIAPLSRKLSDYELVIVGAPIWAFHPAAPIRSFLRQEGPQLANTAFFLTHGGSAGEQSLREMGQLAGQSPISTLLVREADVRSGIFRDQVLAFASRLRRLHLVPQPRAA